MEGKAAFDLVRAMGSQMRFNGILLRLLIAKGVLNDAQARGLIEDVKATLPDDSPFHQLYDELLREFP